MYYVVLVVYVCVSVTIFCILLINLLCFVEASLLIIYSKHPVILTPTARLPIVLVPHLK